MSRNTQFYSQKNHSVVITPVSGNGGSVTLQDFAPDAPITWGYISNDKISVTEGLDASKISVASTKAGKITVKLKPTSPSIAWLTARCNEYKKGDCPLFNIAILTGVNEHVTLKNAAIQRDGDSDTGGATMTDRSFVFIGEELILAEE